MGRRHRLFAPISAVVWATAVTGACSGTAGAETTVIRPGPCAAQSTYLLAGNSGALIRADTGDSSDLNKHVIVFRRKPTRGWASQRLLKRFDLKLNDQGGRIYNSGAFCIEAN